MRLFFKNLLVHSIYALIGGVVVFCVVVAVVISIDAWKEREFWKSQGYSDAQLAFDWENSLEASNAIRIVKHRKEDADVFTVTGTAVNDSQTHWSHVQFELRVFVDTAEVNSCVTFERIIHMEPGEKRGFKLVCSDTYGGEWPSSMRYEVTVDPSARMARENIR